MHCFFQVDLHGTVMPITSDDVMIIGWCMLKKIFFRVLYNMSFICPILFRY